MTIAGMAMPAMREIPTGAPINVPSCQRIFFLRLHGFLPQNVQPEGLQRKHAEVNVSVTNTAVVITGLNKGKSLFSIGVINSYKKLQEMNILQEGSKGHGQTIRALGSFLFW